MRFLSLADFSKNDTINLSVTEILIHEFKLADETLRNQQQSQIINMMNVNYTSKMSRFLGQYGPF